MSLRPGTKLGPYELVSSIGVGGMGEVYEARDPRLNRFVAVKVISTRIAVDTERRRRFVQEAQLASGLQHPNIVTVFDIGTADEADYLAMELVRGRPLDELIPESGLAVDEALRYATQIADALAAAHAAGIVHRDLKPSNIMVTGEGRIKVLDFGLATLTERGMASETAETGIQTVVHTGAGTIVGTVAYMSPEQAEGKKVDARSDLFSFGAILYEMLSGHRAFKAESAAGTLAAVMTADPKPISSITRRVPEPLDRLIGRCLRKDVTRRAQHASDVKLALEEVQEEMAASASAARIAAPAASPVATPRTWLVKGAWAAAGVAVIAAAGLWLRRAAPPPPSAFEPVPLTTLPGSETAPTFSPDGSQVAFQWIRGTGQRPDIYTQLIGVAGTPLRLTSDGATHTLPAWSPDGKWIAMWHVAPPHAALSLVSAIGGPERPILNWDGALSLPSWSPDGRWLALSSTFGRINEDRGVMLVAPGDGTQVDWAKLDPTFARTSEPAFSPDGTRVAYTKATGEFTGQVYVVGVGKDGRPVGAPVPVPTGSTESGTPCWTADGQELLVTVGSPTSNGGVVRVDLSGRAAPRRIAGLSYARSLAISRDGTKLAFARGGADFDIWRIDLQHPDQSVSLAHSSLYDAGASYSPDGTRIAFSSNRAGSREIWVADANGENVQPLTHFGGPVAGTPAWSPDGKDILFDGRPDGNSDILLVAAAGGPVRQLTKEPGEDARPAWSPDGEWIYFSSDRGGRSEIWRMARDGSRPSQITRNGGSSVVASSDGQWLYYHPLQLSSLRRIRPDGRDDEAIPAEGVPLLTFVATPSGLWFVSRPTEDRPSWWIRQLRPGDRTPRDIVKIDFPPGSNLNLSISPDERYVLITKPDLNGTDLFLVDHFR